MSPKKILVPLVPSAKDLESVHYALSLAERLSAHVYILQQAAASSLDNPLSIWMGEALLDLINSARQAGLVVSHHITHRLLEEEIVGLVRNEGIDVLVFGDDDAAGERLVLQNQAPDSESDHPSQGQGPHQLPETRGWSKMTIIMISSMYQSGREELAHGLARKTGWPVLSREELVDEARKPGIKTAGWKWL